jgi:DUF971 family protein
MTIPVSIKRTSDNYLKISWNDGHSTRFPLTYLRDRCPCAVCSGESDLFGRIMMPANKPEDGEGKYRLAQIKLVGNYAMTLEWGDGHSNGIYSWRFIEELERESDDNSATGSSRGLKDEG